MLGLIDDHDIEPEWNPPGCSPELQKVHTAFASAHSHVHHSAELQKGHTAFASAHSHVHHSAELQKVHTAFASAHSHVHHSAKQSCTLHNLTEAQPFRYAVPLQAQRVFSQATWRVNVRFSAADSVRPIQAHPSWRLPCTRHEHLAPIM